MVAKSVRALEAAEDGVVAAFELVLTPALFAFFGYLLDKWLGTGPILLATLGEQSQYMRFGNSGTRIRRK